MCRWPDGDLSFVSARNKQDAIITLDEWDNAELAELRRVRGKKKAKLADTELGKSLQGQMGAPAALVNRYVKQVATEMLKKSPASGRKQ